MLVNKKDLMTSQTTRTQRDSKLNGRIGWQPVVFSRRDDRSKCFRIRIDTKESYALDENKSLNLWQSELPFPRKTFLYNLKYDGNIVFSGDLINTLYPNDLKINPRIRLRNKVFIIISFFFVTLKKLLSSYPMLHSKCDSIRAPCLVKNLSFMHPQNIEVSFTKAPICDLQTSLVFSQHLARAITPVNR